MVSVDHLSAVKGSPPIGAIDFYTPRRLPSAIRDHDRNTTRIMASTCAAYVKISGVWSSDKRSSLSLDSKRRIVRIGADGSESLPTALERLRASEVECQSAF